MSGDPVNRLCRNTAYAHGCSPHYEKKYGGYCLECANAGVPELAAEVARLGARLAECYAMLRRFAYHDQCPATFADARDLLSRHAPEAS